MFDYIQGEKFKEIADFTFAPANRHPDDYDGLPNTLNFFKLKEVNIVYTHTIYAKELLFKISQSSALFILITHNSDVNVDDSFIIPVNVIKWFAQNANTLNPKIESIPIGLENNRWFPKEHKKEKMEALMNSPKEKKNWLYVNINVRTNPEKRQFAYEMFKYQAWATCHYGSNGRDFDNYIGNIDSHLYVLCPEGNGIDTHRFWETLYMGSVPVVKRNINNSFYEGLLPILYVDDWQEVTFDLLKAKLNIFNDRGQYKYELLTFTYWKGKILKAREL